MTRNPYAPGGAESEMHASQLAAFPRTSLMAIFSLVLGILSIPCGCAIGIGAIPGVIGTLLGIGAMVAITRRADGSLQGRGLAVGGIVTGTIGLFLSIAVLFGMSQMVNVFGKLGELNMSAIENLNVRGFDQILSPSALARLDEAKLRAFKQAVEARHGKFVRVRPGLTTFGREFLSVYRDPRTRTITDQTGLFPFPIPVEFDKGPAHLGFLTKQGFGGASSSGGQKAGVFEDIVIIPESGDPIWLLGPATPSAAGPASGPTSAPANSTPSSSGP